MVRAGVRWHRWFIEARGREALINVDIHQLLQRCRGPMLLLAMRLIQPREVAEDTVQQALLALLEAPQALAQAKDPRLYVFGVMKYKIADALRQRYRQAKHIDSQQEEDIDELLFAPDGHWAPENAPLTWGCPENRLQSRQFFALVDACLTHLPDKIAKVFGMKVLLEFEPEEICHTLQLNKTDYWQCMSRARKQLQICLAQQGIKGDAA